MSLIEKKYTEALMLMTGPEKVQRTLSLFGSACEMLKLQIQREHRTIGRTALRKKIAERLYLSDLTTQELLKRIRTVD